MQHLCICTCTFVWILVSGAALVFLVPLHSLPETIILQAFVFPIILNACVYGGKGGFTVALLACVMAGSRILVSPHPLSSPAVHNLIFQIVFFNTLATITSLMSHVKKINELKYIELFNNLPVGLYRAAADGRLLDANNAFVSFVGCTDISQIQAEKKKLTDFFDTPKERTAFISTLAGPGNFFNQEQEWKSFTGDRHYWVRHTCKQTISSVTGNIVWEGSIVDLTETKTMSRKNQQLEEQLHQSQKMQALGTLTSGITHDFNNMLQSAMGYTQKALRNPQLLPASRESILHIDAILEKSADLVRRILSFSRKTPLSVKRVDINAMIREILPIILSGIPLNIDVNTSLDENTGSTAGDQSQLEQAFLNLIANAVDAMPQGGILSIRTQRAAAEKLSKTPGLYEKEYASISVSDTGEGMSAAIRKRIFEPFYTTKPLEHGTGLGLALVYGITRAHKGDVVCSSTEGKGSTFRLFFPLWKTKNMAPQKTKKEFSPLENTSRTLQILVVDDEAMIRETVQDGLEMIGHEVMTASGGHKALTLLKNHTFDVVILDLGMPGISGEQCLQKIHKLHLPRRPKIIVASGFINTKLAQTPYVLGADAFLPKPYKIEKLQKTLQKVMCNTPAPE